MKNNQLSITGKVNFVDIETGYWALVHTEGKYRIENMPEDLKIENLRINATIELIDNEMSVFMSGIPVKLINYKII